VGSAVLGLPENGRYPRLGEKSGLSLIFGTVHWVTAAAALAAVVNSTLACCIDLDNLLAPIVAHALRDLVALWTLARMKPAFCSVV
jgi:membrane protease YdiL (CAAX protease family)